MQQPPGMPLLTSGSMIAEKYRVERVIGRGGFGVVVRAMHVALRQTVAIKILTEGGGTPADQQEDEARFRREAKATAAMNSEFVVRILDVDVAFGVPYIVMEYLDGETLHDVVYGRGTLSIADGVDVAIQVLAALGEAHRCGVVHRDLKPANVFLLRSAKGPVVKVLDFGVSKLNTSTHITKTGTMLGTVAYVSPEQLIDAKRVDGRADLWSLALVMFEAMSKKLPFGGGNAASVVNATLAKKPIAFSEVRPDAPAALVSALARALEKNPDDRFQSAAEMAEALAPFSTAGATAALAEISRLPRPPKPHRTGRDSSRVKSKMRRVLSLVLATVGLLALAALAFGLVVVLGHC